MMICTDFTRSSTVDERVNVYKRFMGKFSTPELLGNLVARGFFTAPASTKYHGNYEGGLFDHSLIVASELVNLTKGMKLEWCNERSPFIVGMFHDLCKADMYELDEDTGMYVHRADPTFPGHGAKSVFILSQLMQLTEEEVYCIRYHMGAYEKEEWNHYGAAIERYPNVLFTHTADMVAARIRGV